ncbi:MAG: hypothetical protein DMG11_34365 [Acidobacteria bacterium]|nr:MAG: hypothetical protein DMG11_34365 [Acidobacteriota bacterium]
MNRSKKKPSLILILAAVLLVLLPLLAWLQYEWIGQVSEGDRERMNASLRRSSNQFREDFDREIARIFSMFQVEPGRLRRPLRSLDGDHTISAASRRTVYRREA